MSNQTIMPPLKPGDRYTIAGHFKRRTFWQWLTRCPREVQEFVVPEMLIVSGSKAFVFEHSQCDAMPHERNES